VDLRKYLVFIELLSLRFSIIVINECDSFLVDCLRRQMTTTMERAGRTLPRLVEFKDFFTQVQCTTPRDLAVCRPLFTDTGGAVRGTPDFRITPYPDIGGVMEVVWGRQEMVRERIGV